MELLDASMRLLPMSKLIESLQSLLARTDNNVSKYSQYSRLCSLPLQIHQQALRSLGYRLNDNKLGLEASQAGCLAFLPNLAHIVKESSEVSLKKTAVVCMDRIAELFGKRDVAAIVANASIVAGDVCLRASENSLRIVSLLCLATMVEVTSHSFISILPLALPKAVDSLATSIGKDTEDGALHNAVYSFLGALILYAPWMITRADLALILKLSFESANAEINKECDQSRTGVLRLLPRRVEAKDCLGALDKTWMDAVTGGPVVSLESRSLTWFRNLKSEQAVKEHLEVLRLTVDRLSKSTITQHSERLGGLFLMMFDLRRIQLSPLADYSYEIAEIGLVEDIVNDCVISVVYKLNDTTFRPIFSRMFEWTRIPTLKNDMKARIHRQTTWYTFLLKFFGTLKVCFRKPTGVSYR